MYHKITANYRKQLKSLNEPLERQYFHFSAKSK